MSKIIKNIAWTTGKKNSEVSNDDYMYLIERKVVKGENYREVQRSPTQPSTCVPTQPQLKLQFHQVGIQYVGTQFYFTLTYTSTRASTCAAACHVHQEISFGP